jgi:hypothetical protein
MLAYDDELARLCEETHMVEYRCTAFYDGKVTEDSVPITSDGSLTFNADQNVQGRGSVFITKDAGSLLPKSRGDVLAPYGQELRIDRVDRKGSKEWVTSLGQFPIQKLPSMREKFKAYPNGAQIVGWSAQVDLQDRFAKIIPDDFLYPDSPRPGRTTWQEIQRLSPIPIVVNTLLPDRMVPGSLTAYPDSRMDALTTLFSNLGAYPHMTRLGALTGRRKDAWLTSTVPVFTIKGIISMDDSMSNDLYNAVRVTSSAGSNDLVAVREIRDPGNPLRVTGPFGRRVYTQSSPLYETQGQLDSAAETILARVSTRQSKTLKVTALPRPWLELGDYIEAVDTTSGRRVRGEITAISASLNPTSVWEYELITSETL